MSHDQVPNSAGSAAPAGSFAGRDLMGRDLIGLGAVLVGAVVGGLLLGLFIDAKTGSSPLFTLLGIGLGVVLGAVSFVLRVRRALRG